MTSRLVPLGLLLTLAAGCGSAGESTGSAGDESSALTASSALVNEASEVVRSLTHTTYQHATFVNAPAGVFDVDCSGFTNFVLQAAAPAAFRELQKATVTRPLASSYVDFIEGLRSSDTSWTRVSKVRDLVAGDVIAWRMPADVVSTDTGHVMIVDGDPSLVDDEAQVAIIDSTETGHGKDDPRSPGGVSGVGRATTVVLMNADGSARGYRWSTDADSAPETTDVVMAHLE